ncbi:YCF48-related protein [Persicitalea sp.]|uniref:YCF48-related protein n=1 Tax=Persicitalea sp. TaxID=3100273 RepID=UPI0035947E6C
MRHLLPALCFFVAVFSLQPAQAQFTVSGPKTICTGSSATLTAANCGGTLKWSTGETTASISVSPAVTTTYYVTCTVGSNKTTGSLSPIVVPGLQLNSNVGTCLTDQATLSVPGVPIGSNLRWERDGVLIPGAGSNNYTATQPGVYTVKSDIPTSAWTWQNLLPDGEDFNDIFFATDFIGVAVGNYGKIVRTTDGGQTWNRVAFADKFDLSSVHFTSPSTGWLASRTNGLYKTTDGGLSWNRSYAIPSDLGLSKVFFTNNDNGWLLSPNAVWKTTNGGYTWTLVHNVSSAYIEDIFFADASTGWLSIGSEIKKTTDGGSTWNTVLTASEYGYFYKVFFSSASEGWAVGRRGLHKTTNGGSTWTDYSGAVPFGLEFRDVYFSDSNHGTVVSSGGIYRTTNGGSSWNLTNAPPIDPLSVFMRSSDKAWAAGRGGRLLTGYQTASSYDWKTTLGYGANSGASVVSQRTALDFVNNEIGWVGNGNDFMLKTTNGGKVWEKTTLKDVYDVDFIDENTGYAVAKGISSFPASIYKSTDGGNTWTAKYNFANGTSPRIQFVSSSVGWVFNASEEIYRTTDGGNTWTASATGIFLGDLFFVDALHGWVSGANGQAARTTDGGITWTPMNVGTNFIQTLYFKNQNEGWSLGLTTRKTTDGGVTWTANLSDGVPLKFKSMDFSGSDFGIALGYDLENNGGYPVYKTLNGGSSWIKQSIPTHTQFTEIRLADPANAWISDGRGAIMHYAAPTITCAASVILRQNVPGPVVTSSTHNALCEGESITLTASGCPSGLSWSDGSTGKTITVTPYASTSYTAFCDAGNGCKGATYTGVAVIPKIRLDTASSVNCGRPVFTASNYFYNSDILWKNDGTLIQKGNTNGNFTPPGAGTYTAEVDATGAWAPQMGAFTNTSLHDVTFTSASVGFVVGSLGTILKTSDGGISWKTLPSGTKDDLNRIHMVSPAVGWAIGYGPHTFKTTDGGNTWLKQKSADGNGLTDISFADENVGWVTSPLGIYRTADGGATWTTQLVGTNSFVAIHAISATTAWVVGYNGRVKKTTDGGSTWADVDVGFGSGQKPSLGDVFFIDANHGWITGSGKTLLHTADGGASWESQDTQPGDNYASYNQVQFLDNEHGWIKVSDNYFLRTDDGGQTWSRFPNLYDIGLGSAERFYMTSAAEGVMVGGDLIARTTDGAATWHRVGGSLSGFYLSDLHFVNSEKGFAIGAEGDLLSTANGGKSWNVRKLNTFNSNPSNSFDLFFLDDTYGWILGSNRALLRTTDGGTTWTSQQLPITVAIYQLFFVSPTVGWGVGFSGFIFKTTDGGLSWVKQTSNTNSNLMGLFFLDANRGWVVGVNGNVLVTTDGGANWNAQSSGIYSPLHSVYFTSPTEGWAVGPSPNSAIRTRDGGVTWEKTQIDPNPNDSNYFQIQFVDQNNGFVSGSRFVYTTKDGGATWKKSYPYPNTSSYPSIKGMSFTDSTHGWVIGTNGILSFHPAAAPCASAPVMVLPSSVAPLSTTASGNWDAPYVWSCGTIPTALDDVRINAEHIVTLPGSYSAKAKSVDLRGQIQYSTNAGLQMGQE